MTIEIHEPELEALIRDRMESGLFGSVEDVLLQALRSLRSAADPPPAVQPKKNFTQFLLESPLPGSGLSLERAKDYPRTVEL